MVSTIFEDCKVIVPELDDSDLPSGNKPKSKVANKNNVPPNVRYYEGETLNYIEVAIPVIGDMALFNKIIDWDDNSKKGNSLTYEFFYKTKVEQEDTPNKLKKRIEPIKDKLNNFKQSVAIINADLRRHIEQKISEWKVTQDMFR